MTRVPPHRAVHPGRGSPEDETSPAARPARHPTPTRLDRLPSEGIGSIGRFLDLLDLQAARAAAPALRRDLAHVFRSTDITHRVAPAVSQLGPFRRLAGAFPGMPPVPGSIAGLSADLRERPLEVLGTRILVLPVHQQEAAIRSFLDVPIAHPARGTLAALRSAAGEGRNGLLRREALLALGGAAAQAVASGGRVQDVARASGIVGEISLWYLDRVALLRGVSLLRHGNHSVAEAVHQLGMATDVGRAALDMVAVVVEGQRSIDLGESWQSVVARMRLTHADAVLVLRTLAVQHQIARGQSPLQVAQDFGYAADTDRMAVLSHALETVGQEALRAGMDMRSVARWLGIGEGDALSDRLRWLAAHRAPRGIGQPQQFQTSLVYGGPAETAVRMGGRVNEVARALGITYRPALRRLERLASFHALAGLRDGTLTAPQAALRLGLVTRSGAVVMQWMALLANGEHSIAAGEPPQHVAARLGIMHGAVQARMYRYAAFRAIDLGRPPPEVIAALHLRGAEERVVLSYALQSVGRRALLAGSSVPEVASRLGVQDDAPSIDQLESIAAAEVGRYLVLEGFAPSEVADRLGIRDPEVVAQAAHRLRLAVAQPFPHPPA